MIKYCYLLFLCLCSIFFTACSRPAEQPIQEQPKVLVLTATASLAPTATSAAQKTATATVSENNESALEEDYVFEADGRVIISDARTLKQVDGQFLDALREKAPAIAAATRATQANPVVIDFSFFENPHGKKKIAGTQVACFGKAQSLYFKISADMSWSGRQLQAAHFLEALRKLKMDCLQKK